MFDFLKRRTAPSAYVEVDIHSHLLPGIDDGAKDIDDSVAMISRFEAFGFRKLITTPHIMPEFYPNTPEIITSKLAELQQVLREKELSIELDAAAEYYLDDYLMDTLSEGKPLLVFGENYLLFETSFLNEPATLREFVFRAQSSGYQPVMAHPERYAYLFGNDEMIEELRDRGVLFQLNTNSLLGFYPKPVQSLAHKLVKKKFVDFLGSDCHNMVQLEYLMRNQGKQLRRVLELDLANNQL